ncbi:HD domain-containing protein [Lipingzhangella sp. LS1_29]|uniref:HD domain-containing protein n=1 Tax=Lipingzhangella rawalii TaxID=2055835 RepID=A0ABU2H9S0_9ACTN|nr:HD domain-containing phosphohydrolase [Lipingzhangella rawalii]MDS1272069.1 HD domain-containing protein [Lipingzhangella rawalii]
MRGADITPRPRRSGRECGLSRSGPATWLVVGGATIIAAAALLWTLRTGFQQPLIALVFGVVIACGELSRITLPGNREIAPIATAGGIGYTFLTVVGGQAAEHSVPQVIAVTTLGLVLGELPYIAISRQPRYVDLARRLLLVALLAVLFRPLVPYLGVDPPNWWLTLTAMAVLLVITWTLDFMGAAWVRAQRLRTRYGAALADEWTAHSVIGVAIGSSGILIALASSVMGVTAVLVFLIPLLVTQVAFRRFAEIRRTYLQTVRALSRVTEVGGYVDHGHSRRVSQLARSLGRELGLREGQLLELEYASLMHDIGQLSLRDPVPQGATVFAPPGEQRRIAELGSAVIRETGVLDAVAELVRRQCEPPEGVGDGPPPLGSRIIKVANAFDDLLGQEPDASRVDAVVDRIRMDSGSEYDPRVVAALARLREQERL